MNVIGIDFGTASNKIGCFDKYGFRIIANNYRNTSTPSVAFLNHPNKWFFCEKAVKLGINKAKKLIFDTKTMTGRKFNDPLIQSKANNWPFKIENEQDNIKIVIKADGKNCEFYPYQITGLIFNNLFQISKVSNFSKSAQIIISIPTIYNMYQVNDLTKAVEFAGFQNFYFQSEPILASIAYIYNKKVKSTKNYNILIYDLGSSHLDVSIIQIHDETYEIHTEQGDISGKQFDDNTYFYVEEQMRKKYEQKNEFLDQPNIASILHQKCEEAKIFLSDVDEFEIILEDEEDQLNFTLTLNKFNEINNDLFERSMKPIKKVLEKAKINQESIDDLFLVGGSTYMKKIRKLLFDTTQKVPCSNSDPREAVAIGACIAGAWMKDQKEEENQIHDKFSPFIDILMSKSHESNSEGNDHVLIDIKEKVSYTEKLPNSKSENQCSAKPVEEKDFSDSEINYFWIRKSQKPKQKENELPINQSSSLKSEDELDEKLNQNSSLKSEEELDEKLNQSKNSSNLENSPKSNEKNDLLENKENDSPKPKINYFWFNANTDKNQKSVEQKDKSVLSPTNLSKNEKDDLLNTEENQKSADQNTLFNYLFHLPKKANDDLSNTNENQKSVEQNDKSNSSPTNLAKNGKDDLSNTNENQKSIEQNDKSDSNSINLSENEKDDLSDSDEKCELIKQNNLFDSDEINLTENEKDDSFTYFEKHESDKQKNKSKFNSVNSTKDKQDDLFKYLNKKQKSIKQQDKSRNKKDDLPISNKKSLVRRSKRVPLYVCLESEENQIKPKNQIEKSHKNNCSLSKSKSKISPCRSNSVAYSSKRSPLKEKQNLNYSSEKVARPKTNSKQNTPQKSNKNDFYNKKESEIKPSPCRSNSVAYSSKRSPLKEKQNLNYSSEKVARPKTNSKQNTPQKSNKNDLYGQKESPLDFEEPELKPNSPKVSMYPQFKFEVKPKPIKKTNFNIYQNSLIIDSNQNNSNIAPRTSTNKSKNQINSAHPMNPNSTKIFFKIH